MYATCRKKLVLTLFWKNTREEAEREKEGRERGREGGEGREERGRVKGKGEKERKKEARTLGGESKEAIYS